MSNFNEAEGPPERPTFLHRRKLVQCAKETLGQASELLKKRIPCAGHFLAPKSLWLKRVSTPNCDVVICFPPNTNEQFLLWLLNRLKQSSGLILSVHHHASTHTSAFYVTAPVQLLKRAAEDYHLTKPLKQFKGGGLKEFFLQDYEFYEGAEDEQTFFTSEERQWLVVRLLESVRARREDISAIPGVTLLEGQPIVPKCITSGIISQVFPIHEPQVLERLQQIWVQDIFARQPLDEITEYFGVKIGMYFAWLGHYTTALSIPAVVGFVFWLTCTSKHQTIQDVGYVLFSIFNVVWVTTYLQAWKRYSAELAFRWGTLDQRDDLLAEPRPLFRGPLKASPVTGRLEPYQPVWKRHFFRYCVSVPIIAFALITVFLVMIVSLQIQVYWDAFLTNRGLPLWLGYIPKVMLAVVISLMDEAYFKIAIWLNDKENYRLETKYENHLIGKVALFQFVNSFLSLFYIAFYLQDQARLKEQLAALLISRQVIGNLKESALPYVLEHLRLAKMSFEMWGALSPGCPKPPPGEEMNAQKGAEEVNPQQYVPKRSMSQAELESSLYKYDGTFADYLEMTIQLGYVILFSSAFPAAALCAMLNNLIEIRSDAFKLAYVCQRPFGQRVPNIGTWQNCMEYMSIMAVLVNCALIGLSGQVHRMFPDMTATQTILLIVALEHIMLVIRFIITCAIPDIPGWLATEMAKIEWARRNASRVAYTNTPTPEETLHRTVGRFSVSPSHSSTQKSEEAKLNVPASVQIKPISSLSSSPTPTPTTPNNSYSSTTSKVSLGITADSIPVIPPFRPRKPKEQTEVKKLSEEKLRSTDSEPLKSGLHTELGLSAGSSLNVNSPVGRNALGITADSIQQIPPFTPRKKSNEWAATDTMGDSSHHLTIGPSGGVEWAKRLKEDNDIHRSTDCITPKVLTRIKDSPSKDASSSDSELHRTSPLWPPRPRSPDQSDRPRIRPPIIPVDPSLSDSARSISSQEADDAAKAAEELAAKKTRVKQSLMKRARSVAIFSLKLKERRAREAQEKAAGKAPVTPSTPLPPPQCGGGELSCIPIEKLIQLEDIRKNVQSQPK
ncbi:anoctamin-8 isoform X2 [Anthonomus grandis grandis]|uniref:anoctamin-8 isoform X2 n=1 Tax=Anthonomus grandis grandis TaxID=2921223 RepID=UPI0021658B5F|nr:anoctamin-8 isoform X2 [Anthonomus grandis grandis]